MFQLKYIKIEMAITASSKLFSLFDERVEDKAFSFIELMKEKVLRHTCVSMSFKGVGLGGTFVEIAFERCFDGEVELAMELFCKSVIDILADGVRSITLTFWDNDGSSHELSIRREFRWIRRVE